MTQQARQANGDGRDRVVVEEAAPSTAPAPAPSAPHMRPVVARQAGVQPWNRIRLGTGTLLIGLALWVVWVLLTGGGGWPVLVVGVVLVMLVVVVVAVNAIVLRRRR